MPQPERCLGDDLSVIERLAVVVDPSPGAVDVSVGLPMARTSVDEIPTKSTCRIIQPGASMAGTLVPHRHALIQSVAHRHLEMSEIGEERGRELTVPDVQRMREIAVVAGRHEVVMQAGSAEVMLRDFVAALLAHVTHPQYRLQ